MMDTYHVEYYTKDGQRVGVQISAYCSQDVIDYAKQLPSFKSPKHFSIYLICINKNYTVLELQSCL